MDAPSITCSIYHYPSRNPVLIGTYGVIDRYSRDFVDELESRLRRDYHDKVTVVVERIW